MKNQDIDNYLIFAVVSVILNPFFGTVAVMSSFVSFYVAKEKRHIRLFSDLAYGFAFVGILVTVLLIVEVYAFGKFPESAYYDREELIKRVNAK